MQQAYTTKDIAEAMSVTVMTVHRRANRENWPFSAKPGRGGGKLFDATGLPEDVRMALAPKALSKAVQAIRGGGSNGADVTQAVAQRLTEQGLLPTDPVVPVCGGTETLSPALLVQAGQRADLVRHYMDAKKEAKAQGQSVVQAAKQFVALYNTGAHLPGIHQAVGKRSYATLERWAKEYRDSDYECLVLLDRRNRPHNLGASQVTVAEWQYLLSLLLHQHRLKIETAINLMKYGLKMRGDESPSSPRTLRRAVERFKKQFYDVWTLAREGEKALRDKVLPYLERDISMIGVGDVLVADGHVLNFRVQNPWNHNRPCRASLILFMDWASRDVVGYSIMMEEDVWSIHAALFRSILYLGHMPRFVLLDNGKAFKAKIFTGDVDLEEHGIHGLYARLGIQTCFAWPYNARAKAVERFFGTMGDSFERMIPSFSGASIADKPARMMRNETFMRELSPEWVPTLPEVYAMLDRWLTYYRQMPHQGIRNQCPGDVMARGRTVPGIDAERLWFLMMPREVKKIYRNGISFAGRHYYNDMFMGFRDTVQIRYDWTDLSRIWVYDTRDRLLCVAYPREKVHPMHAMGGPEAAASMPEFKRQLKQQRQLASKTRQVVRMAAQQGRISEIENELPWAEPGMTGTASKLGTIVAEVERDLPGTLHTEPEINLTDTETPASLPDAPTRYMEINPADTGWMTDEEVEAEWKRINGNGA